MVTRNRRTNSRRVTIIRSNKYNWIVWRSNLYYHWNWLHYSTLITLSKLNSSKMKLIWWLISLKRMLGCLIHPRGILHSLSYTNWFSRFARPVRKLSLMRRQGGTSVLIMTSVQPTNYVGWDSGHAWRDFRSRYWRSRIDAPRYATRHRKRGSPDWWLIDSQCSHNVNN